MKKKALVIGGIVIAAVLISAVVYMIPPRAEPLVVPDATRGVSMQIIHGDESMQIKDSSNISAIMNAIGKARPTRIMSVNDTPPVKYDYYTVKITEADQNILEIYVYSDDSCNISYIELPYQGVYKTDVELMETLRNLV